jgi:hypothetical protein
VQLDYESSAVLESSELDPDSELVSLFFPDFELDFSEN